MKKICRSFIVILLVLSMLAGGSDSLLNAAADAMQGTVYVSDVQIFQSSSLDECVQLCREAGYIPYERDLNSGAVEKVSFGTDIDAPCVMLGYTTTTNVNLAVTDISLLRMGEGYEIREYQAIAAALLAKNQNYAEGLAAAAADFAENYDKGAPSAVQAYKMLDLLYVDDLDKHSMSGYIEAKSNDSPFLELIRSSETVMNYLRSYEENTYRDYDWSEHVPLSDYIIEGNADAEFFGKLLSLGTPAVVNSINSALCTGSAEYENYYNAELDEYETRVWADRLYESDIREMIAEGLTSDEWRTFDSAYLDTARQLAPSLQEFATQYLNAKASEASIESLGETGAEDMEGVFEEAEDIQESDLGGLYMAAHEILNRYRYDETQMLGDWIVAAGKRTYSTDEDYRRLYVLADVFSPAQLILIKYCGFCIFADNMLQSGEDDADEMKVFNSIVSGLKSMVGKGEEYRVSVWMGVDNSVYYGKVAMTSDAIRQAGANAALQLTQAEKDAENARVRNMYLAIGSGVITVFTAISNLALYIKGASLVKAGVKAGIAAATGFWAGLSSVTSFITKINLYLLLIEVVITVALFIYKFVKNELHVPSSEYTEMPSLLFESKNTSLGVRVVKYNAIREPYRGRIGDLNAYVGSKWNILYLSHDPDAGSPLVVPEGKDPFVMKMNENTTPEGYQPVAQFGQTGAADMNYGAYDLRNGEKIFLFSATEKSQNGGNTGETVSSGKYIGDLKLFSADTVERAKAQITTASGNYYAFDQNLGTESAPCYIGYSLTNVEENAITDIRYFAGENASSLSFGGAQYTLSGTLPSGGGIYISRNSLVGTPIGAEIIGVSSPDQVPEGWEPIIHFSGAPVAFFGEEGHQFAIYFEPKVKYTQGTRYVGGFCFYQADYEVQLSTTDNKAIGADDETQRQESVDEMISVLRWQMGGIATDLTGHALGETIPDTRSLTRGDVDRAFDLCSGLSYTEDKRGTNTAKYKSVNTHLYLVYSLTYNPYRAIRDAALYSSATANDVALFSILSKEIVFYQNGVEKRASGSYAVCDVHYTATAKVMFHNVSVRPSHAYVSTEERGAFEAPAREDGGGYKWQSAQLSMRGLYVLGPVEGMEPLTASDVVLSSVRSDSVNVDGNIGTRLPAGSRDLLGDDAESRAFHSVQDIKYSYNEAAQNLSYPALNQNGYNPIGASDPLYMYLSESVHRPKYIASVTMGTYTEERFRENYPNAGTAERTQMNAMSEDNAWRAALAGSGEIIPVNLIATEDEAWNTAFYSEEEGFGVMEYEPACSYIGVSRTDDVSKAICGMLLMKKEAVEPGTAPITEIVVGGQSSVVTSSSGTGTTYYLSQGTDTIPLADGDYYLYYSFNPASIPGTPLTEVTVDSVVFASGMSTVLSANERGKEAKLFGNSNVKNYIHMKYDYTEGSLFNAVYIGTGANTDEAFLDLLKQGAVEAARLDVNQGSGEALVIGWRTMTVTDEDIALHAKNKGKTSDPLREAIRDIILTVDEPYQETLIHNGVVYKPVRDKNFNEDTEGSVIYMYTCTDYDTWAYNVGKSASVQRYVPSLYSDYASPIARIGLTKGDKVPYNTELEGRENDGNLVRWENVLTTDGVRADLNRGDILISEDGKRLIDNRVYVFVHRADNTVKKGAEITGGFTADRDRIGRLSAKHEDWTIIE